MRLQVRAAPPEALAWLERRTGCYVTRNARGVEAVRADGTTAGMVVLDAWMPNSVQAHMAVDTPVAWRALLPAVAHYVFVYLGKQVLLGLIPEEFIRSARFARAVGFREAYRVRDGWREGEDLLVFEMRREECPRRWLGGAA